MSAAEAKKSNWIKQNYDKLLLVLLLVALLASALYLLMRIRGERQEIEQGSWQNPSRPVPAEMMDLTAYVSSNAPLTEPFMGEKRTTNALMVSELRVMCVNDECAKPIPWRAAICPFCKEPQPDPGIEMDRDNDNIPDEKEKEMGMDPMDPNDAMADFDGDGFTNLEEFISGTDINDPKSTPPPGAKLRLGKARATPFELIFVGALGRGESQKFQLNSTVEDRTYFARLNEDVIGYTVQEYLPDAEPKPTLVLIKGDTTKSLVLDFPAESGDWVATLVSLLDGERFNNLRKDSELKVKGFTYKVVDIQGHQVVIKDANSDKEIKITVPLITQAEFENLKAMLRGEQTRGGMGEPGMEYERRRPATPFRR